MNKSNFFILGYSGLNDALIFKKEYFNDLSAQEYRISQGFDSAAAIFNNGKLIAAAEEERFTAHKHTEKFPKNAIEFCLQQANIKITEVDAICHGFDYSAYKDFFKQNDYCRAYYQKVADPHLQERNFKIYWPGLCLKNHFFPIKHHFAHAASAFYPSGFNETLVLVADGLGELDSISIFHGKEKHLTLLAHYNIFSSLGMLYSMVTRHLGFNIYSGEGKVMGLAPYGNPDRFSQFFSECLRLEEEGEIFISGFLQNKTLLERETYRGFSHWLTEKTFPPRLPDQPLLQQHQDLAASLQETINQSLLHLLNYWRKKTNLTHLCYAGGVALNCTANGLIFKKNLFEDIYIQPAAGDAGTAVGAALYHHHHVLKLKNEDIAQRLPLFGPLPNLQAYLKSTAVQELLDKKLFIHTLPMEAILEKAASLLAQGKVIGWVQGSMEFGPRALGNRSVLADPRDAKMRDKINKMVKKRETFRPFAPAVKLEKAHIYFEVPPNKPFSTMLFVVPVRTEYQNILSAVTHVDGTARIQTVAKNEHPLYWQLLDRFESETGCPMLLNTSFNIRGQPIVKDAQEAIKTFLNTDIDALFIENNFFEKITQAAYVEAQQV